MFNQVNEKNEDRNHQDNFYSEGSYNNSFQYCTYCGRYERLIVDDYNEISIDIEDIIFADNDKYLPDSILEQIYIADEPYDYFIEYINNITREMLREKLNKLMKDVDNCTMF